MLIKLATITDWCQELSTEQYWRPDCRLGTVYAWLPLSRAFICLWDRRSPVRKPLAINLITLFCNRNYMVHCICLVYIVQCLDQIYEYIHWYLYICTYLKNMMYKVTIGKNTLRIYNINVIIITSFWWPPFGYVLVVCVLIAWAYQLLHLAHQ